MKHQKDNTENDKDKKQTDLDEAVLLKDWDIARFFPTKASELAAKQEQLKKEENRRAQLQRQSKIEIDEALANYKALATPPSRHKLLFSKSVDKSTHDKLADIFNKHRKLYDSESKGSSPFFRGFRRENSDLSPMPSTRHSAIYFPKNDFKSNNDPLRSSGIFNQSRSHAAKPKTSGEPVLVDFIKFNDSMKARQEDKRKLDKNASEKKVSTGNPIDALKTVAALIRQDSENDQPSRESSIHSDSPVTSVTNSIVYTKNISFEKANTPDLTANTIDNDEGASKAPDTDNVVKPRREKTESDIVFRKQSQHKRHTELMAGCGQEAVLTRDQVIVLCLGWLL